MCVFVNIRFIRETARSHLVALHISWGSWCRVSTIFIEFGEQRNSNSNSGCERGVIPLFQFFLYLQPDVWVTAVRAPSSPSLVPHLPRVYKGGLRSAHPVLLRGRCPETESKRMTVCGVVLNDVDFLRNLLFRYYSWQNIKRIENSHNSISNYTHEELSTC